MEVITGKDSHDWAGLGDAGLRFDIESDLVCTADREGRFTSLNAAWERVLGWTREELMAKPFIAFVHPDDVERTAAATAKIAEADEHIAGFENRYRTKQGEWRWLQWSARTDGDTWFAVAFDVSERKLAQERLREALTEERLLLYGQPIVDARSGKIVQEELLVRLRGVNGGPIEAPGEFLPEAERHGMIGIVDRLMTARGLRLAGQGRTVQVNLSARSLADGDLMEEVIEAVERAGPAAGRMIFEITESAVLEVPELVVPLVERMARLGCRFALDDFGTGLGSLTHLRELPVQILKIDASFVRTMRSSAEDRAVVRGVATIAKELGLQTVAEGVEDMATYELLNKSEIDLMQGYLFGRPAPIPLSRYAKRRRASRASVP